MDMGQSLTPKLYLLDLACADQRVQHIYDYHNV